MQHGTTYHTAKLEKAPVMVVWGNCGHQLESYVDYLHLAWLFLENHVGGDDTALFKRAVRLTVTHWDDCLIISD